MMQIFPRSTWQFTTQPVVGPPLVRSGIRQIVCHYTSAKVIPADIPAYLRSIQNDYTVNRGYSIGYNFAIDQQGRAWELRGLDIKCAANKGENDWSVAVLFLVNGADPANPAMVATARELVAHIRAACPGATRIVGHQQIGATGCPGAGLQAQVVARVFEPTTPTPPEEPDVKYLKVRVPGDATRAEALVLLDVRGYDTPADRDAVGRVLATEDRPVTAAQYDALLAVFGS